MLIVFIFLLLLRPLLLPWPLILLLLAGNTSIVSANGIRPVSSSPAYAFSYSELDM